ncbi:MAG: hypothetical protein ACJ790_15050 [Myxococcaceae bacterium]
MLRRLPFALAVLCAWILSACFQAPAETDCLKAGTCECRQRKDCASGLDCVDGKCVSLVFDAGIGLVGDPCASDSDCTLGPCLPKGPGNGGVCSIACSTDGGQSCPGTWQCKPRDDGTSVCVPPFSALCQSCKADNDCNIYGDKCVTIPVTGHVCGVECGSSGTCPDGYACQPAMLLDGGFTPQCVPTNGSCECSPSMVGLTRACHNDAGLAVCFGVETCQGNGTFSACDAPIAGREICDGKDNDCDGLIDQSDPTLDTSGIAGFPTCQNGDGGSCVGLWTCGPLDGGGFGFFCSAKQPVDELCNGQDDNCNGRPDETFLDTLGRYADVHHCNACGFDCEVAVKHLANDGGVDGGALPGSVACEVRGGSLACVPKKCEPGFVPWPPSAPEICEPINSPQCRPCSADSDCSTPGDKCVGVGSDPGSFCAQACDVNAPYAGCTGVTGQQGCCPADSICQQTGAQKLCVPTGNSCLCSPPRAGFKRSCIRDAGTSICVGTQTCAATGSFDVCDTAQTNQELCDGLDNDCNGTVDDPFVNTKGSGTWDTDDHCGSCTQNCLAAWSPTIQHAIGGCIATSLVAPNCQIVKCTAESVAGGGLCRLDSECSAGQVCSPTFHQCVRACTTAANCGGNGSCVNGFCTAACTVTSDCTAAFGPAATCDNGTCKTPYQFQNADKDPSNGCECAALSGVQDDPDLYSTYPTAGLPYVDRDCDGVDGVASRSLFVWAQSPSSQGTRASPYKTIREALAAFVPGVHNSILVAAGTYVEQVVLRNGVKLYGGYSSDFSKRDVVSFPTLIEAPEPDLAAGGKRGSVNAEGITSATVIAGFTIRGYDVTFRPAAGAPARNSYAVYVKDCTDALVIQNNHILGGRGGDASPGTPGGAGTNGGVGGDGLIAKECATATCANESQAGGAAGTNAACSGTDGNPGASANGNLNQQLYTNASNGNGVGGTNAQYEHQGTPGQPGATDPTLCKYDCLLPTFGKLNGGSAQNGSDGAARSGGAGCTAAAGSISGDDWLAGAGGTGVSGTDGRGAGGGGAGGGVTNRTPATCTVGNRVGDLGGTGGGGGAGGCGGRAGGAGRGGGGSFGVFVVFTNGATTFPKLDANLVELGGGGQGGNGGAGGDGGLGGQGGEGGAPSTVAWCAGLGGKGGRGGNGGAGGAGGGGCGGSAFGIAGQGIGSANYDSRNSIPNAPAAAAGSAGVGGNSPAGGASNGIAGSSGVAAKVQAF